MRFFATCVFFTISSIVSSFDPCIKSYRKYGYNTMAECSNATYRPMMHMKNKNSTIFKYGIIQRVSTTNLTHVIAAQEMLSKALKPIKKYKLMSKEPGLKLSRKQMEKLKIWDRGVIPYYIDEYSFDKVLRDRIREILDEVNSATGLQFLEIPRPPIDESTRYVFFINRRGYLSCYDHAASDFTNEGIQKVILGYDCICLKNGMAGLIMTLVGIPPQHNAPGRDGHIEVVDENILEDKKSFFEAVSDDEWLFDELEYDFHSAGHYPYHKYTAIGGSTIRPKNQITETKPIGEDSTFSPIDLMKIGMLYNRLRAKGNINKVECSKLFKSCAKYKKPKKKTTDTIKLFQEASQVKKFSENLENYDYEDYSVERKKIEFQFKYQDFPKSPFKEKQKRKEDSNLLQQILSSLENFKDDPVNTVIEAVQDVHSVIFSEDSNNDNFFQ